MTDTMGKILEGLSQQTVNEVFPIMESSLSRIWQHIENPKMSFGVMSAYLGHLKLEENEVRHIKLKEDVRKMGYGYIEMDGGWATTKDGVRIVEEEPSLFIPKISYNEMLALGDKYEQYSVIHKFATSSGDVIFKEYATSGSGKPKGTVFNNFLKSSGRCNFELSNEATKEFFSRLLKISHRGRKFIFPKQALELKAGVLAELEKGKDYFFVKEYVHKGVFGHYHTTEPVKFLIYLEEVEVKEE